MVYISKHPLLDGYLKYNSLNSITTNFQIQLTKTAAVIKNPKRPLSLSLPSCPHPKEGRKASVAPSLWEICVPLQGYGVSIHVPATVSPCSHQQHKGVPSPTAQGQRSSCKMILDCNMHEQGNAPKMQQPRAGGEALPGHGGQQLAALGHLPRQNIPAQFPCSKHATQTNLELPDLGKGQEKPQASRASLG